MTQCVLLFLHVWVRASEWCLKCTPPYTVIPTHGDQPQMRSCRWFKHQPSAYKETFHDKWLAVRLKGSWRRKPSQHWKIGGWLTLFLPVAARYIRYHDPSKIPFRPWMTSRIFWVDISWADSHNAFGVGRLAPSWACCSLLKLAIQLFQVKFTQDLTKHARFGCVKSLKQKPVVWCHPLLRLPANRGAVTLKARLLPPIGSVTLQAGLHVRIGCKASKSYCCSSPPAPVSLQQMVWIKIFAAQRFQPHPTP